MINIRADATEFNEVLATLEAGIGSVPAAVEAQAGQIALVAEGVVAQAIENIPGIGRFLAVRTKIETAISGGIITLTIKGMSEGEAGFPPVSGGTVTSEMNLWAWHEFGPSSDAQAEQMGTFVFQKDSGGVTVVRKSRAAGAGSKYQGIVRQTISGLSTQLNVALQAVGGIVLASTMDTVVKTATKGRVRIARSARQALKSAGVNESYLASLGAVRVDVTSSGQINVLLRTEGGYQFARSSSLGIPTTIRTR